MISLQKLRLPFAAFLVAVISLSQTARGQTATDVGAWSGIMLSPTGALTPVAHNPSAVAEGTNEWALRYGRWRYDADDAVHDNVGISWTHGFARFRTRATLTMAYGLIECHGCAAWTMGGVDLQSVVWRRAFAVSASRSVTVGAGLKGSLGLGQSQGEGRPSSLSAVAGLPLEVSVPVGGRSSVILSFTPGYGYGRATGSGFVEGGTLPMMGSSIEWRITPSVALSLGLQRVLLEGAPGMSGLAISWSSTASSTARAGSVR